MDSTITRMGQHLTTLLESLVAAPETRIGSLKLMNPSEQDLVLHAFNDSAAPYPEDSCIHDLFAAAAAKVGVALDLADCL